LISVSLGSRLAIIIVCFGVTAILAITLTAYRALNQDFQDILTDQQVYETQRISSQVSQNLQTRLVTLEAFSATLTDGEARLPIDQLETFLGRQSALRDLFSNGLLILDETATAIAEDLFVPGRIGTNYADRAHFAKALETRKSVISKPIIGRTTGTPILSFATPIQSDDGDLLGFLVGSIDLNTTSLIPPDAKRVSQEQKAEFLVIDTGNLLYVESNANKEGIHPLPAQGQDPLIDAALSGLEVGRIVKSTGEELIFATSHLERLGWMFIRAVPQAMATAPATRSFNQFFLLSLVVMAIILPLGYLITRSAMKPLDRLTHRVREMSGTTETSARLEETGPPEVRNLAGAFNQLQDDRDAISQMQDDFISNVSHELRTPLTSMNGALRLIASGAVGPLPDKAADMSKLALRNGERLQLLITDLLDFNKLKAGEMQVCLEGLRLGPVVAQAVQGNLATAQACMVTLSEQCASNLELYTDAHRLRQILDNFISNAIKFSPKNGKVLIQAKETDNGRIRLTVSDQGKGIPEDFKPKLFKRFAQAEAGTTRAAKGTGLGLAICRELSLLLGGQVGAYNDEGAHFWVELPATGSGMRN
jgi:signal transduction histidine kinase